MSGTKKDNNKANNKAKYFELQEVFTGQNISTHLTILRFCILFFVRLLSAIYSFITDCDETFNFWEPTHFLLFGWGLQTWEYSPVYALRSYTYIGLHAIVGKLISFFVNNKWLVFYGVRSSLALICALIETKFVNSIHKNISPKVAHLTVIFLLSNAGMYSSSSALLPSSFTMYTTMLFFTKMIDTELSLKNNYQRIKWCVFYIALGALMGWPFSGAVSLPFVFNELFLNYNPSGLLITCSFRRVFKKILLLLMASLRSLAIILIPMLFVEYFFYRKFVIAALNIVFYNIFNPDAGPDLYGTEPWTYYFKNGFLNFNVILPLGLLAPLITLFMLMLSFYLTPKINNTQTHSYIRVLSTSSIAIIWWLIFNIQPHKEERFLFVIYPLICFNAAISLVLINTIFSHFNQSYFNGNSMIIKLVTRLFNFLFITSYITVSLSRILSQHRNYYGTMSLYLKSFDLISSYEKSQGKLQTCVGTEWYRFPSHFLLPENTELKFVKANFDGLLPGYFLLDKNSNSSGWRSGSHHIPATLNNLNKEELDKYVSEDTCDFFIGTESPNLSKSESNWNELYCTKIVDTEKSNTIGRAFLFPFIELAPPNLQNQISKLYKYQSKDYCLYINNESQMLHTNPTKNTFSHNLVNNEKESEEL